jgi:hypothetical protein
MAVKPKPGEVRNSQRRVLKNGDRDCDLHGDDSMGRGRVFRPIRQALGQKVQFGSHRGLVEGAQFACINHQKPSVVRQSLGNHSSASTTPRSMVLRMLFAPSRRVPLLYGGSVRTASIDRSGNFWRTSRQSPRISRAEPMLTSYGVKYINPID